MLFDCATGIMCNVCILCRNLKVEPQEYLFIQMFVLVFVQRKTTFLPVTKMFKLKPIWKFGALSSGGSIYNFVTLSLPFETVNML